jgi:hypothetical protein
MFDASACRGVREIGQNFKSDSPTNSYHRVDAIIEWEERQHNRLTNKGVVFRGKH